MAIRYYTDETDFRLPAKGRTARWIARAAEGEGFRLGAVNFIFCGPERHLEMNRTYLGHDWPTDVITFDYSADGDRRGGGVTGDEAGEAGGRKVGGEAGTVVGEKRLSGDIFIDPATVAANAAALCVAPEVEMRRVMVHGVLHLCGRGDKTPRERKQMRAKEDFYLRKFYESV